MRIRDPLYGSFEIRERVLLELLRCPELTRLRDVSQNGLGFIGLQGSATNYSRLEHSIGVMLLLRRLGANTEEQAAGLLHDASHTAFSHTIDMLFDTRSQEDYAGKLLAGYIRKGPLGRVLSRNSLSAKRIGEYEEHGNFNLLERPIPESCADRLDNGLRYMHYAKIRTRECVEGLTVRRDRIVFASRRAARKFACEFEYLRVAPADIQRYRVPESAFVFCYLHMSDSVVDGHDPHLQRVCYRLRCELPDLKAGAYPWALRVADAPNVPYAYPCLVKSHFDYFARISHVRLSDL